MPTSSNTEGRRDFLHGVLGAGVAAAGASLLGACASPAGAAGAPMPAMSPQWDMSWTAKLGKFRTAYDSAEHQNGAALSYAAAAIIGYKQVYRASDGEFTPVLILRHVASIMALDDDMWSRLDLGESYKLKDPTTGEDKSKRNPFLTWSKEDKHSYTGQEASLSTLLAQGAIVLTCNNALTGMANMLRRKETGKLASADAALAEIHRHVIPGAYVMPNGIFAVSAAQDAGCHYMKVQV